MTASRTPGVNPAFADRLGRRRSERAADEAAAGPATPGPDRPRVLVVDDELEITRSIAELLGRDYDVQTASSADEGLALLRANTFAVVLTDQRMPGGTGAELLAQSVAIRPDTSRILFTGYSDIGAVIDAVNEGQVHRYVTKPWKPSELKLVLSQALERHRLVTDNRRLVDALVEANAELEKRVLSRTRRLREQNRVLRVARKRIEELSRHDALTGLVNRRWLDELLPAELERSERYGAPLAVAMTDIDHFKAINDAFGHAVGDEVLRATAKTIEGSVRLTDVVARYGGEEFLVLLPNTGLEAARILAERMCSAVRSMPAGFRPEPVTASFGIAAWVLGDTVETLVARADGAMYMAKRAGRDRVAVGMPDTGEPSD